MSNPLYDELRVTAEAMLDEFGRDITYIRYTKGGDLVGGTASRAIEMQTTLKSAVVPASGGTLEAFDVRFFEGISAATDVRFAIVATLQPDGTPAAFMPSPGDEATFDGRTWLVMGNTPLNVDGTPVTYSIGFRGP